MSSTMTGTSSTGRTNALEKLNENVPSAFIWRLTLLATLGGFLFGYDTSNIGSALPFVTKHVYTLGSFGTGYLVAGASLGAAAGALIAGPLTDKFGRRLQFADEVRGGESSSRGPTCAPNELEPDEPKLPHPHRLRPVEIRRCPRLRATAARPGRDTPEGCGTALFSGPPAGPRRGTHRAVAPRTRRSRAARPSPSGGRAAGPRADR